MEFRRILGAVHSRQMIDKLAFPAIFLKKGRIRVFVHLKKLALLQIFKLSNEIFSDKALRACN